MFLPTTMHSDVRETGKSSQIVREELENILILTGNGERYNLLRTLLPGIRRESGWGKQKVVSDVPHALANANFLVSCRILDVPGSGFDTASMRNRRPYHKGQTGIYIKGHMRNGSMSPRLPRNVDNGTLHLRSKMRQKSLQVCDRTHRPSLQRNNEAEIASPKP